MYSQTLYHICQDNKVLIVSGTQGCPYDNTYEVLVYR